MRYYLDVLTGSIYAADELAKMVDRRQISVGDLLYRFEELPADQHRPLQEAAAATGRPRGAHPAGRLGAWFGDRLGLTG